MVDTVAPERRSEIMGRVRGKNTQPELVLRRLVYAAGYRYRLHRRDLPGTPDLIFAGRRKVLFVHGCFWHRHENCPSTRTPKSKVEFWTSKFERTRARDSEVLAALTSLGWTTLVVWECELARPEVVMKRVQMFLEG